MAALLWAQLKSLPRLMRANLVIFLSLPVFAISLWFGAFVMAKVLTQPELTIFALAVALGVSILMVGRQETIVSQDEWVLTQPINAQTFATFSWLTSAVLSFCFSAAIVVPAIVCFVVGLSKVVELPSVLTLVFVLALNSLIGSLVTASRLGRQGLALIGQVWHIWTALILMSAILILLIASVLAIASIIHGSAIAKWTSKIAQWVETPAGMLVLLPIMPTYFAVKSVMEGFNFIAVLWLVLLALIALVILLGALDLARPFNEATFLQSQRMRRLSAMGIWDRLIAKRERIRSVSGFGEGETALLWLNWLSIRRTYGIAFELSSLIIAFVGFSTLFLLRLVKEPLDMALAFVLLLAFLTSASFLTPEWLKSQPISLRKGLLMLSFPQAIRAFLFGIGTLLAIAIFRPEFLSAIQVASFVVASFGVGLGTGFSAQATKFTWAAWATQWNFVAMFLQIGIAICFAFFWFMTLTDFWLFGLLLTWGCCWLTLKWAETVWHSVP